MDPLDLMSDTTSDSDDLGAMLGGLDGDLEFFDGLFEDIKQELVPATVSTTLTARSDRRRQRWRPSTSTTDEEDTKLVRKSSGSSSSLPSLGWKEIAKSQKKQRAAAETLNTELRKVLAAHMEANWKMLKLTQRANRLAMRLPATSVDPTKPYVGPTADLARIHYDLDALVREAEVARASTSDPSVSMDVRVLTQENNIVQTATGAALESTLEVAWVMPFNVDAITDALALHTVHLVTKMDGRDVTTLFESSGLKVVQAVTRPKLRNGMALSKHGQLSTRCEPANEDGSRVIVLAARGTLVTNDASAIIAIEADGYVVVSPVPGHDSETLGPLSRIQWCHRFRYQPSETSRLTHDERAAWIHDMSSKAARNRDRKVDKVTRAMENLLLSSDKRD